MSTNIIDAFLVTFGIDKSGYDKGVNDIDTDNKKLRETQKKTFDGIEEQGKRAGASIKGLSREVIGLGLAFMGAKSVLGFVTGMTMASAGADRLGTALGVNIQQIWAWRQAVKTINPNTGAAEADQALQTVQGTKLGLRTGQVDPAQMSIYARLGISAADLLNNSADQILRRISAAQGRMDPQLYSGLLGQLGLSQSVIFLFNQGQAKVDALLKQYEGSAQEQEDLAKKTEDLQKAMIDLDTHLQEALIPVLIELVPVLKDAVVLLSDLTGKKVATEHGLEGAAAGALGGFVLGGPGGALAGAAIGAVAGYALPAGGASNRPTRNNNPGDITDSDFARRQPGYIGSDGRFARFATPEAGNAAMENLLASYMARGRLSVASIIANWQRGDPHAPESIARIARALNVDPNQRLDPSVIPRLGIAIAQVEGYANIPRLLQMHRLPSGNGASHSVTIGHVTVNTRATDAKGIARDLSGELRRRQRATVQADPVVTP